MNRVFGYLLAAVAATFLTCSPAFAANPDAISVNVLRVDAQTYRSRGLVEVTFTPLAALYFLSTTNPAYARILALLERSASDGANLEVTFQGNRILDAEYAQPKAARTTVTACDAVDAEAARELLGQPVGMPMGTSSRPAEVVSSQCIYDGAEQSQFSVSLLHFGTSRADQAKLVEYRQSYVDTAASVYGATHTDDLADGQVLWAERPDWEYVDVTAFIGGSVVRITMVRGRADVATIKELAVNLARTYAK